MTLFKLVARNRKGLQKKDSTFSGGVSFESWLASERGQHAFSRKVRGFEKQEGEKTLLHLANFRNISPAHEVKWKCVKHKTSPMRIPYTLLFGFGLCSFHKGTLKDYRNVAMFSAHLSHPSFWAQLTSQHTRIVQGMRKNHRHCHCCWSNLYHAVAWKPQP